MLFEGLKENDSLVIVPSSAADTMNLGGLSGLIALAQDNLPEKGIRLNEAGWPLVLCFT